MQKSLLHHSIKNWQTLDENRFETRLPEKHDHTSKPMESSSAYCSCSPAVKNITFHIICWTRTLSLQKCWNAEMLSIFTASSHIKKIVFVCIICKRHEERKTAMLGTLRHNFLLSLKLVFGRFFPIDDTYIVHVCLCLSHSFYFYKSSAHYKIILKL